MTHHHELDGPAREACALAALGVLPPDEAAAFVAHAAACPACRAERAALVALAGELIVAAPEADPPERLWQRIEARLNAAPRGAATEARAPDAQATVQPWKAWTADVAPGLFSLAAGAGRWEPTASPGVEARKLFVDAAAGRVTMLVRMAPGASFPGHRHDAPEECFVLEGDLWTGAVRLRAGDYQRAEAGSRHVVQSTQGGCVLLLVSSLADTLD
jgi:anti-sigma factor ChrR (cupin superfamily)